MGSPRSRPKRRRSKSRSAINQERQAYWRALTLEGQWLRLERLELQRDGTVRVPETDEARDAVSAWFASLSASDRRFLLCLVMEANEETGRRAFPKPAPPPPGPGRKRDESRNQALGKAAAQIIKRVAEGANEKQLKYDIAAERGFSRDAVNRAVTAKRKELARRAERLSDELEGDSALRSRILDHLSRGLSLESVIAEWDDARARVSVPSQ